MSTKDLLHRFIFDKAPVRGEFICLEESFRTIIHQHAYPQPIRHLLGEALCVAGLLSAIIKFNGRLTVQFRGKGKLKLLLAQCDNQFRMRALAKWDGDLSYEDLMEAFNEGVLVIMLDSGLNKNRYQGIVAWRGNSLAESIEGYFRESEQLATKIWLAVDERRATGFLLQVVPAADKDATSIEKAVISPNWDRITKQAAQLDSSTLLYNDYPLLLQNLFPEEEIRIFPSIPASFHCSCSRKRGEDAILLLGREEAEAELQNNRTIVVTCDFCNQEYVFDAVDVARIFENKDRPPSDIQLH
ncbi:Hsp33 family molecular chaperone HslO [Aquicella lusitana]|uniref:Molecular chaperone Hsp33 n=1 Tax=Aquicella lusitana TaxID=254246 RepID=A0A370GQP0_9COXI|nr:Hsp33 family molecular chaperone HslO [Aquicella lusitana]RDI46035.1 molecular chaperone Hsp33 [Aquicella lusitana]VVC73368.1 33 kDa chaperonin [Aquicella lusitana]